MRVSRCTTAALVVACLSFAGAASAETKTVKMPLIDSLSSLLMYDQPQPEVTLFSDGVWDDLLCWSREDKKYHPLLAESWKQTDEYVELRLRDGIQWHDGADFSVDDVVYTIDYLINPKSGLRFARNWDFIESVSKIDDHTVRINTKGPAPVAFMRLATGTPMLPKHVHEKLSLKDKSNFGRETPIGTGPFKVESHEPGRRTVLVRNQAYEHGNACKPAAGVDRVEARLMPDVQTQLAELMTGGVSFVKVNNKDQVKMLRRAGKFEVTASQGLAYYYLALDSIGRSGNEALKDVRVREAVVRALNRPQIVKVAVAGGDKAQVLDALCTQGMVACGSERTPYSYDPELAKKLLAEAGYAGGFELTINAPPGYGHLAEIIAGELRKVGIRGKVNQVTWAGYRQLQREGKQEALLSVWTQGGVPDSFSFSKFFFGGGARDFWHDEAIDKAADKALQTLSNEERTGYYTFINDRTNEMAYILPVSTHPEVFVHDPDLVIPVGSINPYSMDLNALSWR